MLKVIQKSPWYSNGLSFKCTGCGQCCTGAPGFVWVTEPEIQEMMAFLSITREEFSKRYLRIVEGRLSLIEDSKSYDCVFLKDNKCEIYSARPTQCRTFPWWPRLLKTKEAWQEAAHFCEGIHPQAPVVPLETIEQQRILQEECYNGV